MIEHEVLFDGTKHRQWGRMLFAEESVIAEPQKPTERIWGKSTQLLRQHAQQLSEWRTAQEIAELVGLTRDQVAHAISHLIAQGSMIRGRKQVMQRQRYKWVTKDHGGTRLTAVEGVSVSETP